MSKKVILNITPQTHVRATQGDSIFFRIPREKLRPAGLSRLLRLEKYNKYKVDLCAEAKAKQEAEAREARNEIKAKLEAVKKASSIESKDLPRYASILGYDINDTEEELRFNIENFAIEDPFDFLDRMDDTSFEIDSYISLALDKKIVFIS